MAASRSVNAELTNICVIKNGDLLLLQERSKPWDEGVALAFPGGHLEPGEAVTESVVREIREETGLTVINPRLCGVQDWLNPEGRYIIFCYLAEEFTGELKASEEGRVFWAKRTELDTMRCSPALFDQLHIIEETGISEAVYKPSEGYTAHFL